MALDRFPNNRGFAFTVFDDTDDSTVENVGPVYELLSEIGMHTTKSVWALPCGPNTPFHGSTLQDRQYLDFIRHLRNEGFEIALHNARNCDATRDVTRQGLDEFEWLIGALPRSHSNHYFNRDNLYWGPARLSFRGMR